MWDVWRLNEAETVSTSAERFTIRHSARRTLGEIVDANECADHAAYRLRVRSNLNPFIQRATLVRLEMTKTDPADLRRIYYRGHCLAYRGKQRLHSRVEQKRLFVFYEKLIELKIDLWEVSANSVDVGGYLSNRGHG